MINDIIRKLTIISSSVKGIQILLDGTPLPNTMSIHINNVKRGELTTATIRVDGIDFEVYIEIELSLNES